VGFMHAFMHAFMHVGVLELREYHQNGKKTVTFCYMSWDLCGGPGPVFWKMSCLVAVNQDYRHIFYKQPFPRIISFASRLSAQISIYLSILYCQFFLLS
jgi:hypothetical protein